MIVTVYSLVQSPWSQLVLWREKIITTICENYCHFVFLVSLQWAKLKSLLRMTFCSLAHLVRETNICFDSCIKVFFIIQLHTALDQTFRSLQIWASLKTWNSEQKFETCDATKALRDGSWLFGPLTLVTNRFLPYLLEKDTVTVSKAHDIDSALVSHFILQIMPFFRRFL